MDEKDVLSRVLLDCAEILKRYIIIRQKLNLSPIRGAARQIPDECIDRTVIQLVLTFTDFSENTHADLSAVFLHTDDYKIRNLAYDLLRLKGTVDFEIVNVMMHMFNFAAGMAIDKESIYYKFLINTTKIMLNRIPDVTILSDERNIRQYTQRQCAHTIHRFRWFFTQFAN